MNPTYLTDYERVFTEQTNGFLLIVDQYSPSLFFWMVEPTTGCSYSDTATTLADAIDNARRRRAVIAAEAQAVAA